MQIETNKLSCLFEPLNGIAAFRDMCEALNDPGVYSAYGTDDSQRIHMLATLTRKLNRTLVLMVPNEMAAHRAAEDLNVLLSGRVGVLPPRDISFMRTAASSRELTLRRLEVIGKLITRELVAIVVPVDSMLSRLMPKDRFVKHVISLDDGMRITPPELMEKLTQAGYERVQIVDARGQCAIRGGILDVYPVGEALPIRLEFFDDEIDSMRSFDVLTQRSVAKLTRARLFPANEMLLDGNEALKAARELQQMLRHRQSALKADDRQKMLEREFDLAPFDEFLRQTVEDIETRTEPTEKLPADKPHKHQMTALDRNFGRALDALETGRSFEGMEALLPVLRHYEHTLLDYIDDPIIALDQPERLRERSENKFLEFKEQFASALERDEALPAQAELLLSYDELLVRLNGRSVLTLNSFMRTDEDFSPRGIYKFDCRNATNYQSNVKELAIDIRNWQKDGFMIALLAGGSARGLRLQKALIEQDIFADYTEDMPPELPRSKPIIFPFTLNHGFLYNDVRFAVISESDIFGVHRQRSSARARSGERLAAFTDLNVGDYVVHENHGIGQYMGTVRLASEGTYRDFLHIRYQGTDKLYVPTDQLDRVQKYIGSEGEAPKLNRLSGGEWQRQKSKVKESIREIAGELLKLYAHREASTGYAFAADTPWQREFEDSFPFEETPDQVQAIDEIKRDMEKPIIMDRLLCGDVGYGKTEVALRAIFKAVMSGKQAALLAPTTILVQQHYATMMNRFHGFPIRVETLSRFKTTAEQKAVIKQLEAGEIDVIVGTHRLLNKDVKYKDLGLLVIDEEQRFGVQHKETIKQMKRNVDVLTLSATPIPRTLHMSMVGIRDMSLLKSPPEERYPVQTYVVEYSDGLVRDALLRELSRGGQAYVLHNRVQTIDIMFNRLKKLVPEARIAVGHGQMREHALEDVMLDFYEGKFDVLLCTTIIEAGLDVPRANTLVVCEADRFGLAQLYQLRGRVGRSNRLAYAYLTVNPSKVLTESADKRLAAIREFTEFGSGFRVAMRDLEIRGAGNILGSEQSGFMASVGYDLYVKMIEETMRELRGSVEQGDITTRVELKIDAYLPQEYISNDILRVEMYKKIASINGREAREDLIEELVDRFGDPNRPVMNLIEIAHLKYLCSQLGIDHVSYKHNSLVMRFSMAADIDVIKLLTSIQSHQNYLKMLSNNPPLMSYFEKGRSVEELLRGAVNVMELVLNDMRKEGE